MKNAWNTLGRMTSVIALAVATTALVGCGSDEQSRALYNKLKTVVGVQDQLTEGEISSGMFGGKITVENPELKLVSGGGYGQMRNLVEQFTRAYEGALRNPDRSVSGVTRMFMNYSIGRNAAFYMLADSAEISSEGDKEDGKLDILLKGVSLRDPFVAEIAGEVTAAREIADEIRHNDTPLDESGVLIKNPHKFYDNSLNLIPGSGNWIINSTGAFGATVDAHLVIERDSSGEGKIDLTLTHHLDGSKMGSITRSASFEDMPDLDTVVSMLGDAAKTFSIGGNSGKSDGGVGLGVVAESFARKAKASRYKLSYEGYEVLNEAFKTTGLSKDEKGYKAFCRQGDIGYPGLLSATKRSIDDSDCAIAQSLIDDGRYSETYQFNGEKTLFAELVVNDKYEVEVN